MLPLSHDEVVHGKGSLLGKMPGDEWQQFANLRLLFGYMWAHPGKKLLFMGGEFGQRREWTARREPRVARAAVPAARRRAALGARPEPPVPRARPRCTSATSRPDGFEWIDCNDAEHERARRSCARARRRRRRCWSSCNFTPVPRDNYRIGVPRGGRWRELLNSDAPIYGGSGLGNFGGVDAAPLPRTATFIRSTLRLPPLAVVVLTPD